MPRHRMQESPHTLANRLIDGTAGERHHTQQGDSVPKVRHSFFHCYALFIPIELADDNNCHSIEMRATARDEYKSLHSPPTPWKPSLLEKARA
ncbi:hypothetical protein J122_1609 [Marinobacter excellens LAMA 842]|uniref:Uncharacterized protein n=1 Tax=Marinobacter excellens LAMA 842 TaxID=1306954 RepID=A0A137SDM1_9GAMM|nr:hypothetical protein J122_1609 [Marinobacter excellens LAMA 842]